MQHSLSITFMGNFCALFISNTGQDATALPFDDKRWGRPIVKRLLIYFAINMGKPLTRDLILDDLWHGSALDTAEGSFKTVFSALRQVLEPELLPKASSRFFFVNQQNYIFNVGNDPAVARTDLATFKSVVETEMRLSAAHDATMPSTALLDMLGTWQLIATEVASEPWAIEANERTRALFVQACLHTANAFADLARPADSGHWAERATQAAPWSEEAWHMLIRARARTGNTAAALRTCDEATTALQRELGAPPSSLLRWLAERLRAGQVI
ncbi:MAG: hypothetical protein HC853_02595 [Anaerolineae bacterium]|nr:hypothetical protein [Anaerolineae bacterium]